MRKQKKGGAMPVEDLIREHRKFGKRLESIGFTVSSKGRQIIVKFGKKLNIIECPTVEAAQSLADGFNSVIVSRAEQISEFITLMEANVQQLSLFAPTRVSLDAVLTEEVPVPTVNPYEGADPEEPLIHQTV